MNDPIKSVQDDLAFMKTLVDKGGHAQVAGGAVFLAGGLLYGIQCLYHWGQMKGVSLPEPWNGAFVIGVTVAFLGILAWVLWRDRKVAGSGLMARALNAVFSSIGMANLVMVLVFGVNSARMEDFRIWMFYAPVIFALQGAAWVTVWQLRRRAWQGVVGFGWLAAAAALGLSIGSAEAYVLIAAAALFGLMALPGWVMMRLARKTA